MKKAFTLIEILVVVTIIGLITSVAAVTYTQLGKQSRDGKRKADLEQIRAALEMHRSSNNYYPSSVNTTCGFTSGITDSFSNTYLSDVPDDPKCSAYKYYYTPSPAGCDNSITFCTDYTVAASLETVQTICQSLDTHCTKPCTYCLGPYGNKN